MENGLTWIHRHFIGISFQKSEANFVKTNSTKTVHIEGCFEAKKLYKAGALFCYILSNIMWSI
jgi:hypothetical protein